MASTTPNIGLTLPTGTEGWQRSVINGNFAILDTKIGAVGNTPLQDQAVALGGGLAIICNGDTHGFIPAGAYIYVYNNTHGLADGLYYNSSGSNQAANSQIAQSMCTAVTEGGLNALNNKLKNKKTTLTINTNKLSGNGDCFESGNNVVVVCDLIINSAITAGDLIASGCPAPYGLTPSAYTNNGYVGLITSANGTNYSTAILYGNGEIHAVTSLTTGYVKLIMSYIKR